MPPKTKVTKREIAEAAVQIVRERGEQALNARAIASKLGCSTQPIFSNYASMDELRLDVISRANDCYRAYLRREAESGKYPPYKASGIAYIRFAKEEAQLFRLLFMRDRSSEAQEDDSMLEAELKLVQTRTGFDHETAARFHVEMWIFVHGIASMLATAYVKLEWDTISAMLTDAFEGIKSRYVKENEK